MDFGDNILSKRTFIRKTGFPLNFKEENTPLRHFIDKESSDKTDYRLQKLLYTFACANNCLNPLLYRLVGRGWRSVANGNARVAVRI